MIRIPPSLHDEVARAAAVEHISINQYVLGVLAAVVSWKAKPASIRLDAWKDDLVDGMWDEMFR